MSRRIPHLVLTLVAAAALLAPAALASGGKPKKHHKHSSNCVSAVCVYTDNWAKADGSVGGPNGGAFALSADAAARLAHLHGKDARELQAIGTYGFQRPLQGAAGATGNVRSPSTFLAALDLGPGPIALFVVLLAGATAFGLGSALRRRRRAGH